MEEIDTPWTHSTHEYSTTEFTASVSYCRFELHTSQAHGHVLNRRYLSVPFRKMHAIECSIIFRWKPKY